ncbi:hypothetical protein VULLAG_LOCUS7644 [Vulpes lagopus]
MPKGNGKNDPEVVSTLPCLLRHFQSSYDDGNNYALNG